MKATNGGGKHEIPTWELETEERRLGFDPVRTVLEDFEDVGGTFLVPRGVPEPTLSSLRAVLVAQTLGVRSVDFVRRKYAAESPQSTPHPYERALSSYVKAYRDAKRYVFGAISSLDTTDKRDPTMGEFGASVALERLPHSFFAAHMLYRLGHRYEGHAVSRHILEQIAWAHAACGLDDREGLRKIVTTRAISSLKRFYPAAGRLYGLLSELTHIDYSRHMDFVRMSGGRNRLRATQLELPEYTDVILVLADAFVATYEKSQIHFIANPQSVRVVGSSVVLNAERPFESVMGGHLSTVEAAMPKER